MTDLQQAIESLFAAYHREHQFSGVGLLQSGSETLFAGAYGYAHRGFAIPNALDTRCDTASITKLFTTVAVLQCVERGDFALATSAVEFLELTNTAIPDDVTAYHLLTHTSGIADDADEEAGESYEALWEDKPNYSIRQTRDFLPQFVHKPPNFSPGSDCRYNNVGFILLGLMIEKATGLSYRDYVQQHIFERLGMHDALFASMDGVHERLAEGYSLIDDHWRKNIYAYPPIGSPDGGAHITAGDLNRFIRGLLGGKMLSAEYTRMLFTPQVIYRQRERYVEKMGFCFHYLTENDEIVFLKKDGENAGVACILSYYPRQDATLAILANQDCDIWSLSWEIHELVLDKLPAREPHAVFV